MSGAAHNQSGEPRLRVLVIEDSEAMSYLVRLAELRGDGSFELVLVSTLQEANRLLDTEHFDAVIADLNLPDSNGPDTVRNLHSRGEPTYAWTGSERDLSSVYHEGADDVFEKSVNVVDQIKNIIQSARLRLRMRELAEQGVW